MRLLVLLSKERGWGLQGPCIPWPLLPKSNGRGTWGYGYLWATVSQLMSHTMGNTWLEFRGYLRLIRRIFCVFLSIPKGIFFLVLCFYTAHATWSKNIFQTIRKQQQQLYFTLKAIFKSTVLCKAYWNAVGFLNCILVYSPTAFITAGSLLITLITQWISKGHFISITSINHSYIFSSLTFSFSCLHEAGLLSDSVRAIKMLMSSLAVVCSKSQWRQWRFVYFF